MDLDLNPLLTAILSLSISRPHMTEAEANSACRQQLDPFVFDLLNKMYGQRLQDFWDNEYVIPKHSDKAIVIVERRAHPNLKFCLQNAVYFCRGYALHVFCSKANFEYVKVILGKQFDNVHVHIVFDTIGTASQGYKEYNDLLKTKGFWMMFPEEHIITMETDCYFRKPLPESIYQYDYVASIWPWLPQQPGGGGLSYRKRSKMLEICDRQEGSKGAPAQDAYACEGVLALGFKFPTYAQSLTYFTECHYSAIAVGTHQWWTYCSTPASAKVEEVVHNIMMHILLEV